MDPNLPPMPSFDLLERADKHENPLTPEEIDLMIETVKGFGGLVSMRKGNDGEMHPYELNVALFDALKGNSVSPSPAVNGAAFYGQKPAITTL